MLYCLRPYRRSSQVMPPLVLCKTPASSVAAWTSPALVGVNVNAFTGWRMSAGRAWLQLFPLLVE
jgi:hypothetical protein